ncbi:hypothetical protein [Klebsiella pneumoniae]|uniref:hypothetical protein n=1 Tax=Klebsiella pneumoniae TaxID=573 RepID=UPI0029621483|nr:hypothetical protein [Klebsiella pneumoniae]MDW1257589.1 hypothetical protein [Klebsiella pneumoniae]
MIIEEVIINDVKVKLSRGKVAKGDKESPAYIFYISLVNKNVDIYRVSKQTLLIWQYPVMTADKKTLEEAQNLAHAIFKYKVEKMKEVLL